jgi:hypothetical protein
MEREDDTPEEKKPLAALPKEESTAAALTEKEHQKH